MTMLRRALWGMKWGLYLAGCFSAQATFATMFMAASERVSLPLLIAGYVGSGVFGGAIVGIFLPYLTAAYVAAAVGFVALLPFGFFMSLNFMKPRPLAETLIDSVVLTAMFGGIGGFVLHQTFNTPPKPRRKRNNRRTK